MPFYDRCCQVCGWKAIDVLEPVNVDAKFCPTCGEPTARAWFSKPPTAIGDEMDHWQENGTKHPIHFRSKIERRRWMKQNNLIEAVRHVGTEGDKSTHTTNWAAMDPYTMEQARILTERAAKEPARNDPKPEPLHVTTTYGDVKIGPGGKKEFIYAK